MKIERNVYQKKQTKRYIFLICEEITLNLGLYCYQ